MILRNITRGEVVETSRNCFTIADLSDVWVVASVPEKDVRFIHPNETVHVVVAAYPHGVYSGRMTYISDVLDQATRTTRIRVTVPNPDRALKPEMFAMVRIDAAPQPDALAVPLAAVQQDGGDKVLFVRQPERRFELRRVRLGDEQDGNVIVLEGLREGEDVVVKGAFAIKSELDIHKIEPTQ